MRFSFIDKGQYESHRWYKPVNVFFLNKDVSNELFTLVILMSRKGKLLLFSTSIVNWRAGCIAFSSSKNIEE